MCIFCENKELENEELVEISNSEKINEHIRLS